MADYSNINHTCPYDVEYYFYKYVFMPYILLIYIFFQYPQHDFIINNLIFQNVRTLPFPIGNYKIEVIIITKGIKIGQFDGHFAM